MHPITALKEHLEEKNAGTRTIWRGSVDCAIRVPHSVDCAICIKHSEVKVVNEEGEA